MSVAFVRLDDRFGHGVTSMIKFRFVFERRQFHGVGIIFLDRKFILQKFFFRQKTRNVRIPAGAFEQTRFDAEENSSIRFDSIRTHRIFIG